MTIYIGTCQLPEDNQRKNHTVMHKKQHITRRWLSRTVDLFQRAQDNLAHLPQDLLGLYHRVARLLEQLSAGPLAAHQAQQSVTSLEENLDILLRKLQDLENTRFRKTQYSRVV